MAHRWGLAVVPVAGALAMLLSSPSARLKAMGQRGHGPAGRDSARSAAAFDVLEKTIPELQAAMAARVVTSAELVAAYLDRIDAYDQQGPRLNAMIAINPHAREAAETLDRERAMRGPRGPLHGIPIVIKDNYETADMPTTDGSLALAGFISGHDAFQVKKLRDAGAVIIGKTNLHELARGITSVSSMGGQTRNPYDPTRNPGGSSGGTGAAVAANFAVAGMGSDTCGSIRIPSANNNLFGLRGTRGLSSRQGIIPLSHTQDIGGPLARSVTDLAIMLDATVGVDPADDSTRDAAEHIPPSYLARLSSSPSAFAGVRLGVVKSLFGSAPEDTEGGDVVRAALAAMQKAGAELVDVTLPGLELMLQRTSVINPEFKFDFLEFLAQHPTAPVHSLTEMLERGEYHASLESGLRSSNALESLDTPAYRSALLRRSALRDVLVATLEEQNLDALAYPVLSRKPAVINEPQRGMNNCQPSASSGLPAMSIPAGFTPDGLPIGLELLGRPWSEARLLGLAYEYEQREHPRRPPPTTPRLVNTKAPALASFAITLGPISVSFVYDQVTGRLRYEAAGTAVSVAIHRGTAEQTGPAIFPIMIGTGAHPGEVVLGSSDRDALMRGDLYLVVRSSAGLLRAQLTSRS